MNITTYQSRTHEFAVYPEAIWPEYLQIALIGEIGEACNYYKKCLRDDGGIVTPEKRDLLRKELGDVCWYISEIANHLELSIQSLYTRDRRPFYVDEKFAVCLYNMTRLAVDFSFYASSKFTIMTHGRAADSLTGLLWYVEQAAMLLGYPNLEAVLDENIAKLELRRAAGTIHDVGRTEAK